MPGTQSRSTVSTAHGLTVLPVQDTPVPHLFTAPGTEGAPLGLQLGERQWHLQNVWFWKLNASAVSGGRKASGALGQQAG